jgi:hypothetical protein
MTRRIFSLLLLTVFGFGLLAGPHPCQAAHEERPGEKETAQPSCHGTAHSSNSPEAVAGATAPDDDRGCCETSCRHACHMTAVAAASTVAFAIAPVSQAVAEVSEAGPPLFAQPIDHIPLG